MSKLFSPLTIKSITLKNRIVISPMCQYSAVEGFANDWHLVNLGSRAVGGAALVIQEATSVSAEGRITAGDVGLYKDEHIEKLKAITTFIKQNGAIPGIQLAHAGRKASCKIPWEGGKQVRSADGGWITLAPSAIPFYEGDEAPKAMDAADIAQLLKNFKAAASRALTAGYQLIEIHAAHGYLLHEFFSPLSNHRTDQYGGSFENRIRILLAVVDAVQSVWPKDLPLFVRISATDWAEGGWNDQESIQLAKILQTKGVDLVDCSSGGLVPHVKIPVAPGYQVPFAKSIKKETGILTGAVGLITDAKQAEDILVKDEADLIFIARESLRDPYFPMHAAKILEEDMKWPVQYERAK